MTISSCGQRVGSVSVVTAMVTVGLVAFCLLATPGWTRGNQTPCFMTQQAWQSRFVKPNSVQLSAIIFYGRRHHVRVLDKYLKQNLVSVGGLLQEVAWPTVCNLATCLDSALNTFAATFFGSNTVVKYKHHSHAHTSKTAMYGGVQVLWFVHTEDAEDIHWLNQTLLPSEPHYYKAATSGTFLHSYCMDRTERSCTPSSTYLGKCSVYSCCIATFLYRCCTATIFLYSILCAAMFAGS